MVGFINAVGVNIILGQLADFTGYDAEGPNRVVRAVDTVLQSRCSSSFRRSAVGVRHDRVDRRSSSGRASAHWAWWSRSS